MRVMFVCMHMYLELNKLRVKYIEQCHKKRQGELKDVQGKGK